MCVRVCVLIRACVSSKKLLMENYFCHVEIIRRSRRRIENRKHFLPGHNSAVGIQIKTIYWLAVVLYDQ